MFSPDKWFTNPSTGFYGHTIGQSLRFNDGDSAYLNRTPSSASNQKTWTWSSWVKRGTLGATQTIFSGGTGSTLSVEIAFNSSDNIQMLDTNNSYLFITTAVFRDPSAWYHIVVENDTTQSTVNDRTKLYVNGTQITSFSTDNRSNFSQDEDTAINSANAHYIGRWINGGQLFDGYMAEVNFIDGTALDPTSFGETKDSVWIPKQYSGSHGTNGFYLPFDDSSAIGDDESANTNDWTANNLAASDVVPDTPTKNFATMNPLMIGDPRISSSSVYHEGNLKVACGGWSTSVIGGGYSTIAIPKDKKIYCEVYEPNQDANLWGAGVVIDNHVQNSTQLVGNGSVAYYNRSVYRDGVETDYGSSAGAGGLGVAKLTAGDVLGIAVDGATGKVWFHRNGTYFKSPSTNNSGTTGNPSAGTNEIGTVTNTTAINPSGEIFIFLTGNASTDDLFVNFGQDSTFAGNKSAGSETDSNGDGLFQYAVPTDYVCLHSGNMSDITIGPGQDTQADDHFDVLLWTGNGSNAGDQQEINGLSFTPDLVWTKGRGGDGSNPASGQQYHEWHDSVRGAGARLFSNAVSAESNVDTLKSFDNDGFTVAMGTGAQSGTNQNTTTMVGWSWKGGGSASTISADSVSSGVPTLASSVSANPDAGFSIVTYSGNRSSSGTASVGHGLGKRPSVVITKSRNNAGVDSGHWLIWHDSLTSDNYTLRFDANAESDKAGNGDMASLFTTTTFGTNYTVGSNVSGNNYVAYVFASVPGFSKVGSFLGGGSDFAFVFTGFRPSFLLVKRSSGSGGWHIFDYKRAFEGNEIDVRLEADNNDAENTSGPPHIDLVSNGFKLRTTFDNMNASGSTYIYLAFAEAGGPFKFANAR